MSVSDRHIGAMLGGAIGDALGMPIEGLSHQNVRTYYKGIKGLQPDTKRRDLEVGQWTYRTQLAIRIGKLLISEGEALPPAGLDVASLRRLSTGDLPAGGAAPSVAAPIAVRAIAQRWTPETTLNSLRRLLSPWWPQPEAQAAAFGQVQALRSVISLGDEIDGRAFMGEVTDETAWAEARLGASDRCSRRLGALATQLNSFPLDLQELCDGTGFAPDEAWPFAVAMFARNPRLVEGTVLSAINVGGDAPTIGACTAALIGAFSGSSALPDAWTSAVEGARTISDLASELTEKE